MTRILYIIVIILLSQALVAQNSTDSLFNELKNTTSKQKRVLLLNEISKEYKSIDLDSAILYQKQAFELSKKIKNDTLYVNSGIALIKLLIAKRNLDTAKIIATNILKQIDSKNNQKLQANTLHNLGNVYLYENNFDSALFYYQKALKIREEIKDTLGISATTNNIGYIYWKIKNLPLGLKYFRESFYYDSLLNNELDGASALNNIGVIYWQMRELDSAAFYFKKALKIKKKYNQPITTNLSNIGVLYRSMEQYDSAEFYFFKVLNIRKKQKDTVEFGASYYNLGDNLFRWNKNDLALKYLDSAKYFCLKAKDFDMLKDVYNLYSAIYTTESNYKKALDYKNLYIKLKDSLYNENLSKQLAEMQAKYEADKKQREIEMQQLKLEKQKSELESKNKIIFGAIAFVIIVLILSAFLFKMFIQKKKANKLLQLSNEEIKQQKEEIITQANHLQELLKKLESVNKNLEEKNEMVEASIRYASTIQTASLPLQSEIDKYFENFILYLPKDIVSGDFYYFADVEKDGKKELFFAVADCTGHGVPGAFMSMIGIRLLSKYTKEYKLSDTSKILENIDKEITIALRQKQSANRDGIDIALCKFYDFENKEDEQYKIMYSGAKRNLYYYDIKDQEIKTLKATRKSIGGHISGEEYSFDQIEINCHYNNIIYLFSDGYADQNNIERKKFTTQRLLNLFKENINKPLEEQGLILHKTIEEWMTGTFQRDDITVVGLKLKRNF